MRGEKNRSQAQRQKNKQDRRGPEEEKSKPGEPNSIASFMLTTFFKLVLGLEFMQLNSQLINKLSISSIQSLIWSISVLLLTRLL